MADHVRQQLTDALETTLTGLSTTGTNVFPSEEYPIPAANLPALRFYLGDEGVVSETIHSPRIYERTAQLKIEYVVKQNTDLESTQNQISKEVETALASSTLGGLAKSVSLTGMTTAKSVEGDQPVGVLTSAWEVVYYTAENAPDVAV